MKVRKITSGPFFTNTYIVTNKGEAAVIDPFDGEKIIGILKRGRYKVRYIILTHFHMDHIVGVNRLKEETKAKAVIHGKDAELLKKRIKKPLDKEDLKLILGGLTNPSLFFELVYPKIKIDRVLKDKDILNLGRSKLKVIHTPGHTPGGICILVGKILFSGDTLFKDGIGRTDLMGGDYDSLIMSIKKKLFALDDDTKIYPGHGPETTVGHEKKYNWFVK